VKKLGVLLLVGFFLCSFAATASALPTVTVNYDAGTTNVTTALSGFETTGAMMDGMLVTAVFSDGSFETKVWADAGWTDSGAVWGSGWYLYVIGDTWDQNWRLTSSTAVIDYIMIDAGPGDTVFDTLFGAVGTAGSANGKPFQVTTATVDTPDIVATYSDLVALTGDDPVGDLYRSLTIDFQGDFTGTAGAANQSVWFLADTDNIKFAGDLAPIPEPGTMLLFGTGLVGLAGLGRRKIFRKP
jgi:hypothetical protein